MPVKLKNAVLGNASKQRHRGSVAADRLHAGPPCDNDAAEPQGSEPIAVRALGESGRARTSETFIKAFAKEDAKIIAKASARALRRGLH